MLNLQNVNKAKRKLSEYDPETFSNVGDSFLEYIKRIEAAGWNVGHISEPRTRKRTYIKPGTDRLYRKDSKGKEVATSKK